MNFHNFRVQIVLHTFCILLVAMPLFAQQAPPSVSAPFAGGTISDFKGKVELQIPPQGMIAAARGLTLPAGTMISTEEGRLLLHLEDGSEVVVRPHTKLMLKQPSRTDWRYLQLIIGRIRAEIQKHLGGSPPFEIGTPSAVISVRGTRFLVEVNRHNVTQVDVEEGFVELGSARGLGIPVLIGPGFSSRVGEDSAPEPARPTRELRPELERPKREHDKERDTEVEDRTGKDLQGFQKHEELNDLDEREAEEPGLDPGEPSPESESPPSGPDH